MDLSRRAAAAVDLLAGLAWGAGFTACLSLPVHSSGENEKGCRDGQPAGGIFVSSPPIFRIPNRSGFTASFRRIFWGASAVESGVVTSVMAGRGLTGFPQRGRGALSWPPIES